MTKPKRDDRGAAMLEFAILLPLLLMLVMGIIEFGRYYNTRISIQAAAREGARELALGNDPIAAVLARSEGIDATEIDPGPPCGPGNTNATVTITKTFNFNIPFVDLDDILDDDKFSATGVMRCGL